MKVLAIKCGTCGNNLLEDENGGGGVCPNCDRQAIAEEEEHYNCPRDGTRMEKDIQGNLVLDRCPRCKGYFLSDDELNEIKKRWYDQGFGDDTRRL